MVNLLMGFPDEILSAEEIPMKILLVHAALIPGCWLIYWLQLWFTVYTKNFSCNPGSRFLIKLFLECLQTHLGGFRWLVLSIRDFEAVVLFKVVRLPIFDLGVENVVEMIPNIHGEQLDKTSGIVLLSGD